MKANLINYSENTLYKIVMANKKEFGYIHSKEWLINKVNEICIYTDEQMNYLITKLTKRGNFN